MGDSLGQYLAACRQKAGLSIEDIAERTRVNPRVIRAAEADQFEQLPGVVFIKGFLRTYAKVTGIEGEELIRRYENLGVTMADHSPKLISMPLHQERRNPLSVALGLLMALGILFFLGYYSGLFPGLKEPDGALDTYVVPPPPARTAPDAPPVTAQESPAAEPEPREIPSPAPPAPAAAAKPTYQLKISATQDTWLKAILDGRDEREVILRDGNTLTWPAERQIIISIGNVAGTQMWLNGKPVNLGSPPSNVILNMTLPHPSGAATKEMRP